VTQIAATGGARNAYGDLTQLCASQLRYHVMPCQQTIFTRPNVRAADRRLPAGRRAGPVIDEQATKSGTPGLHPSFESFRFDFGQGAANPFGNLTREQRLARLTRLQNCSTSPSSCPAPISVRIDG